MNLARSKFGFEVENFSLRGPACSLPELMEKHQFVVLRKQSLTLEEQVQLTSLLGEPEPSWEDQHPDNEFVQLMDSRFQIKITEKSSSKYWHLDRSFMRYPTRFTVLYAKQADIGSRGTQILDARLLCSRVQSAIDIELSSLRAVHAFSLRFPDIMRAKGHDPLKIERQISIYPDVVQPLVRKSEFGNSLYFSELCVKKILDLADEDSLRIISLALTAMKGQDMVYEHEWHRGDVLIWDNFSTVHRANPAGTSNMRVLHRTTVGGKGYESANRQI